MSEHKLVGEATKGDAGAVDQLLANHLPGLRAFVRLRMGPQMRAKESGEDVVQSVVRDILQHMDRFQYPGEKGFKQWLYTTALRKIANKYEYYRAAKRDMVREVPQPQPGTFTTADDNAFEKACEDVYTPSKALIAKERIKKVEEAFEQLPEDYREVIVLSKLLELSRAEVAKEMNRSEASVRNLLFRALSRLAEVMETQPE